MPNDPPGMPGPDLPVRVDTRGGSVAFPWMQADPTGNPEGRGPPPTRYLAAILRAKWIVLAMTAVGAAGGVAAARFVKPKFQAQVTFWVETTDRSRGTVDQGPLRTTELLQSDAWIDLLKSYVVLDPVVRQERLYLEPDPTAPPGTFGSFTLAARFRPGGYRLTTDPAKKRYTLATAAGVEVEQGAIGDSVGRAAGFHWLPSPRALRADRPIEFTVHIPRDVSVKLADEIKTTMRQKGGNFLRLSLVGTEPSRTTRTLNAIADRYVEVAAHLKRAKLEELSSVLDEQRRYAEENLREAEIQLEGYRVSTITLPTDKATPITPGLESTQDPVFSHFFRLKVDREQLRSDREAIDRVLTRRDTDELALNSLYAITSVRNSAALKQALDEAIQKRVELRTLRARYLDEEPRVQHLIGSLRVLETEGIPRLAAQLRSELLEREAELDHGIRSTSVELQQIPPRVIEEARLQRRVTIAETLHNMLRQRHEETRLAAASTIPDIRVLDRAVAPRQPVTDQRAAVAVLGLLGALGLALLGVIMRDRFDPKVRYPEHLTGQLGVPIVGAIPSIRGGGVNPHRDALNQASEAFREIRLSLIHAHGAAGPFTMTVSSPAGGEGKSFVSSNLALSFAEHGYRTVVIDADTRRGKLHHLLSVPRTPGLTDFLDGAATLDDVLQPTRLPDVFLIPSGTRMANSPELLSSAAMTRLLTTLRARFAVILVDSPPLGAGVDAYALSTLTRNLVLVFHAGTTDRAFAVAKLRLLERLPVRVLGAILNGIPRSSIYRDYSYLDGYGIEESVELRGELAAGPAA